jgi:hypothetical protein
MSNGNNVRLTIASTGAATFTGNINQNINDGTISLYKADGTTLKAYIGNLNGTTTDEGYLALYKTNVQKVAIRANGASYFDGGNVLIGTTTDAGFKLRVNGAIGSDDEGSETSDVPHLLVAPLFKLQPTTDRWEKLLQFL